MNHFVVTSIIILITNNLSASTKSTSFVWENKSRSKQFAKQVDAVSFSKDLGGHTNTVLLIHNDYIIYEKYSDGFSKGTPQRLWSMTKSFTSSLIGMRIEEKELKLSQLVSDFHPHLKDDLGKSMTIRHLLEMSSGLEWNEGHGNNPFTSNVIDMLYISNDKGMAEYTVKQKVKHLPRTRFNYSSGETNVLMDILKKTFKSNKEYYKYPWLKLFNPLGITSATWERDKAGVFIGSSYLFLSARDIARFGRLYLHKGKWQGQRLVTKDYIDKSTALAPGFCINRNETKERYINSYGFHWWLNRPCAKDKKLPNPSLPKNSYFALGYHGQMMAIFPTDNIIAIRLSTDKQSPFDRMKWTSQVYNLIKNEVK
jgi:CubicO group peptidase (beta-lactamase class C family)